MGGKRLLFVGLGEVGAQVFDLVVRLPGAHQFLVGGRNLPWLVQRTNLSAFAACQLQGFLPEVTCTFVDLQNVVRTAETIAQFKPDIVFCAATLQRWGVFNALPQPLVDKLYEAQLGPWLPVHLTLAYKLMQAVKQTGLSIHVVNATYPDVIHPVLQYVDLAPTTGIGDLANNIPALRKLLAWKLDCPVDQIEVRFVAQHYVSYWMHRKGHTSGAPFHLTVLVNGEDRTDLVDKETVFEALPTLFRRASSHLMTAASATVILDALMNNTCIRTHVPGPHGLVGGYPVRVSDQVIVLDLPPSLSQEEAVCINTEAQRFDGIERIDEQGTVYFTESQMIILQDLLGYHCRSMRLSEVEDWAKELQVKYAAFAAKWSA